MDFAAILALTHRENGKHYVVSAANLRIRWNTLLHALRAGRYSNLRLQRAWSQDGEDAFDWVVLEKVADLTLLSDREQYWMDELRAADKQFGFNGHSAETKIKIGLANHGRKHEGEALEHKRAACQNPDFIAKLQAKEATEELRRRISRAKGGSGATLTAAEVEEVVASYERGEFRIKDLAANYGVSYTTMQGLLSGRGGKQIRSRPAVLPKALVNRRISKTLQKVPDERVAEINALYASGVRQFEIAKRFGLSKPMICRIVNKSLKCYAEAVSA